MNSEPWPLYNVGSWFPPHLSIIGIHVPPGGHCSKQQLFSLKLLKIINVRHLTHFLRVRYQRMACLDDPCLKPWLILTVKVSLIGKLEWGWRNPLSLLARGVSSFQVAQQWSIHLQCRKHRFSPWVGEILWTEDPGRLQSMGSQRLRYDWTQHTHTSVPHYTALPRVFFGPASGFPSGQVDLR